MFQGKSPDATDKPVPYKCPCGEFHRFMECLYCNHYIRPTGWQPDPDIQKRVQGVIDSDAKICMKVNTMLKYEKKWVESASTSMSTMILVTSVPTDKEPSRPAFFAVTAFTAYESNEYEL